MQVESLIYLQNASRLNKALTMVKHMKKRQLLLCILIAPLLVLLFWYQGGSKPLSGEEVKQYISTIQGQTQTPGGRHDFKALKNFLEQDDGKPFYTVNLYNYHTNAQYELASHSFKKHVGSSGRDAFDRFSKVMIRLLANHSSHPIFGSDWVHDASSNWDKLVIVRYRSRRDIAEIFASDEFAEASEHKWAALAENERLLVQGLHIPSFYFIVLSMSLFLFAAYFLLRKKS